MITSTAIKMTITRLRALAAASLAIGMMTFLFASSARAGEAFGVESFAGSIANEAGMPAIQAGSHPNEFTTSIVFDTHTEQILGKIPDGDAKNVAVNLPPGLIVDPTATALKCTEAQLESERCPELSIVGHSKAAITISQLQLVGEQPVYNMVPPPGAPAELAFDADVPGAFVHITPSVRPGDHGLSAEVTQITQQASLESFSLTLLGDPNANTEFSRPLLTLPTSCVGPLALTMSADSWQEPGSFVTASSSLQAITGCEKLDFRPTLGAQPDTGSAGSPAGLTVGLQIPQNDELNGLAEANLKKAVVALPAGMSVNPAAANGLAACSPEQIGLDNTTKPSCPDSSKVGSAEVVTPLLEAPLQGSVYLAQQGNAGPGQGSNPFGSLLALYLVIEGPGVVVKLPGEVQLNPMTGQVTTTFDNLPQLPVSQLRLRMFGGPRAALVTPQGCSTYTTNSTLTPWSGETPADLDSGLEINQGCNPQGFSPVFSAGTTDNQAGAFSPFTMTISRSGQEQGLGGVSVTTPPGLLGILKGVERCGEPQASQGSCGAASLIGHASALAGAGPDPYDVQGGQVFLTGPYKGAPFGLSIVVPAIAGPFNLGNVVVRAAIGIDPYTAQIAVTSDLLPTILQGIPLLMREVNVTIDRPGFIFNPTNCDSFNVTGTLTSIQGASVPVASHFQAANCATLPFKPTFAVSTQGKTSRQNGASLDVKVTSGPGQANIGKVAVTLPKQLPSRLTTIQQACPEATFAANPASCPAGSNIGIATARTPVLANPVSGPAYLVSHGGAAFPDLVMILQSENITLQLVGSIDIKKGVTSSAFNSVPDTPIETFELALPEGPHSALATALPAKAKGNLCGTSLVMPTTLTGQNGAQIQQSTKIAVTGCPKVKPKKKAKSKKHPGKAGKKHTRKGGKKHK
jgi:hypothetical protein